MKRFRARVKTIVTAKDLLREADIEAGLQEARDTMSILRYLKARNGSPDPKGTPKAHYLSTYRNHRL